MSEEGNGVPTSPPRQPSWRERFAEGAAKRKQKLAEGAAKRKQGHAITMHTIVMQDPRRHWLVEQFLFRRSWVANMILGRKPKDRQTYVWYRSIGTWVSIALVLFVLMATVPPLRGILPYFAMVCGGAVITLMAVAAWRKWRRNRAASNTNTPGRRWNVDPRKAAYSAAALAIVFIIALAASIGHWPTLSTSSSEASSEETSVTEEPSEVEAAVAEATADMSATITSLQAQIAALSNAMPAVVNSTPILGDSTGVRETPPVASQEMRDECGVLTSWKQLYECVKDEPWYVNGVNAMEQYNGFNWSDIQQWASTGIDSRAIVVINMPGKSDEQARDDVRNLIGSDADMLPVIHRESVVNTRGLEAETMSPFVDGTQQVRVSLMPLKVERDHLRVDLEADGGVFVDCFNAWGKPKPAPAVPSVPVGEGSPTVIPTGGGNPPAMVVPVIVCKDNPDTWWDDCSPGPHNPCDEDNPSRPESCNPQPPVTPPPVVTTTTTPPCDNPETPENECNPTTTVTPPPSETTTTPPVTTTTTPPCDNPETPENECNPTTTVTPPPSETTTTPPTTEPPVTTTEPTTPTTPKCENQVGEHCGTPDTGGEQQPVQDNDPGLVDPSEGYTPGDAETAIIDQPVCMGDCGTDTITDGGTIIDDSTAGGQGPGGHAEAPVDGSNADSDGSSGSTNPDNGTSNHEDSPVSDETVTAVPSAPLFNLPSPDTSMSIGAAHTAPAAAEPDVAEPAPAQAEASPARVVNDEPSRVPSFTEQMQERQQTAPAQSGATQSVGDDTSSSGVASFAEQTATQQAAPAASSHVASSTGASSYGSTDSSTSSSSLSSTSFDGSSSVDSAASAASAYDLAG